MPENLNEAAFWFAAGEGEPEEGGPAIPTPYFAFLTLRDTGN